MSSREEVYACVDGERDYQAATAEKWNHEGSPSIEAEILMLKELCSQMRSSWYSSSDDDDVRDYLRKVAAVAVRAMENYGLREREAN